MEPAKAEIKYRIPTTVTGIKNQSGLWWVLFEGSWEWLNLGPEQPEFMPGDHFEIILRKVSNAKPSQASI